MQASTPSNPFVGLRPYESNESLLFFGRQQQTAELLQRLHQFNFVAVTGGSGSGKSSIVRAGLIPMLQAGFLVNDRDHWLVCVMKPGTNPLYNFAAELLNATPQLQAQYTSGTLLQKIQHEGIDGILEVLLPVLSTNINLLILVDQFEEIFRFALNLPDLDAKDEAIEFVSLLLLLAQKKELPVYITLTMRSDFIGDCVQIPGLAEALNNSQYLVPRLTRMQLKTVIEAPVRLYRGQIDPALTTRLLNDVELTRDELPLLQHALMRMWQRMQSNGSTAMTLNDYFAVGELKNALSQDADSAIADLNTGDRVITKKTFQALTGIDEKGRKVRRPASLHELCLITAAPEKKLLEIIDRFIAGNRNFLVLSKGGDAKDVIVDISHESLIRQWKTLDEWVDDEADSAAEYTRLAEATRLYRAEKKGLLTGTELKRFSEWWHNYQPSKTWAARYSTAFDEQLKYLQDSQQEEQRQRLHKKRIRQFIIASSVVIFLLVAAFAFYINKTNNSNKQQLALNFWNSSQTARAAHNNLDALLLIGEASSLNTDATMARHLLMDAEGFLPITQLENILDQNTIVNDVAFSSNGKWLVVAGNNGTVKVVDATNNKQVGKTLRHNAPVNYAVISNDGQFVLSASNDYTTKLWQVSSGKEIMTYQHDDKVTCAVFNKDERRVLTACADGNAIEWDKMTGKVTKIYKHGAAVSTAFYNHNGTMIATCGQDEVAMVWDAATAKPMRSFQHNNVVTAAVFSLNDSVLLTTSWDSTARLWNVNSGKQLALLAHNSEVRSAAFHPNGKWLVTGCSNGLAHIWSTSDYTEAGAAMKHNGGVYSTGFSPDGRWLVTAGRDQQVRLWQIIATSKPEKLILQHHDLVTTASYNNDGSAIVTAAGDTAFVWAARTRQIINTVPHPGLVTAAVFTPDGTRLVTGCTDSAVRVFPVNASTATLNIKNGSSVNCVAVSNDGHLIFSADRDNNLYLWDAINGNLRHTVTAGFGCRKAVFSPQGDKILLTGKDSTAYILDTSLGKNYRSIKLDNNITSADFNATGNLIVTTDFDMTARVWDAATLTQTSVSLQHDHAVSVAAFSREGDLLATGGWDLAVRIWSLVNFKQLGKPVRHNNNIVAVDFNAAGNQTLSASDSIVMISEIEGDLDMPPQLLKLQAIAITGATYNNKRGESECLSYKQLAKAKNAYQKQAAEHAKTCGYLKYNFWKRSGK